MKRFALLRSNIKYNPTESRYILEYPGLNENFQYFAFVVNRAPEIMHLPIDPHEHLVQVTTPFRAISYGDALVVSLQLKIPALA